MSIKYYGKLVRDRILSIISSNNEECDYTILNMDEYIVALGIKLDEEVREFQESGETEELADILEVVFAIAKSRGINMYEMLSIMDDKAILRGRFNDRIFLKSTTKKE